MSDAVFPDRNEEEFIDMALKLGYDEIIFISGNPSYTYESGRIRIKKAFFAGKQDKKPKSFDYLFAPAERKFFESTPDFIINAELSDRKDSVHYRRSALNQVHAKLCRENDIALVFSFGNLLAGKRAITLGRMMQNAMLARKYKLKTAAFSLARDPWQMRSRTVLDALMKVLGL